ncbi:2S seed storage protein 1-like [Carica papaya]|uniref:2S seed storage protein 1-like n=1 Tax=Carica papaya TaxID=3649 RepID=UPI000B8CF29D|nr:2S seed storage protein 1-like [Carica papaya]
MVKLTLLLATLTLFLLLVNASIYQLEEDEYENRLTEQQTCRQEFMRHDRLRACQRFLMRQTKRTRQLEVEEEEDEYIRPFNQMLFQRCCQELRGAHAQCRCPMLKQAMKIQQQMGQLRFEEMRQMCSMARNLPNMCQLEPMTPCPFRERRSE